MQLNLGTSMRPEMQQVASPRMIQSMEILTLPAMALLERIEHEMQENPFLEEREAGDEEEGYPKNAELGEVVEPPPPEPEIKPEQAEQELVIDAKDASEDFERLDALNVDWDNHFNEESRPSANRVSEDMDRKHDAMANMADRPQSLQDHLDEQIAYVDIDADTRVHLDYLISHIDERGYLAHFDESKRVSVGYTLEELAAAYPGTVTVEQLSDALEYLQSFEPLGVGARDTKECLLLQVAKDTPHRDAVCALILHHMEDIQHNRIPVIQKKTNLDLKTIQESIEILKRLNPRPGSQFTSKSTQYIVPDILVDKNDLGEYEVKLVDDWTPNIYIPRSYFEMLRDKHSDAKAREFLQRKIQAAKWLIDAIEQRRSTLMKVTKAIVAHQKVFLDKGPEFIEPLKMQQIADVVKVHVTTVSRAVDDKWVQTPRGTFPLKRFFGGGTQTASGVDIAYETIKQKLLDIIGLEDKASPLSDEDLVAKLAESGYPLARRTVTKYRKTLGLQSSRERRVWTE